MKTAGCQDIEITSMLNKAAIHNEQFVCFLTARSRPLIDIQFQIKNNALQEVHD